ncbi:MAG: peptidoglycan DD-metalloendopeptidase family protein [Oscillospiraceae bacterium]|nr:peptidoglycan DD-metalloendopeptidase family protein [Oscillospiraceae bacterium]
MKGRWFKIAVAVVLALATAFSVFAERDYDAEIEELYRQIEAAQKRQAERSALINSHRNDMGRQQELQTLVQEQVDEIEAKVENQSKLIEAKQREIEYKIMGLEELQEKIDNRRIEINNKQRIIAQKEKENEENLRQFGEIVKVLYMTENLDPVAQIMGSSDFYDILVRADMLDNIGKKNMEFMDNLLAEIASQEEMILQLENSISLLEGDMERAEEEKAQLEADRAALYNEHAKLEQQMNAEYNELYSIIRQIGFTRDQINMRIMENAEDAELQEEANRMVAELIRQKQRANEGQQSFSSSEFVWPLPSQFKMITCAFGYDAWRGGMHYGIDIGNSGINGANIYAVQSGTVITAAYGWNGGYGNYVIIDHGDGVSSLYAHGQAGSIAVSSGQSVDRGQVIMNVGSTGWSTGPHLHFEVRVNGVAVNPMNYGYS